MIKTNPIPFEIDDPEAGEILASVAQRNSNVPKGQRTIIDWDQVDMVRDAIAKAGPKVGRNDPCLCGSGKKFKKCCLNG